MVGLSKGYNKINLIDPTQGNWGVTAAEVQQHMQYRYFKKLEYYIHYEHLLYTKWCMEKRK